MQIFDSRGNPTVECDITTTDGMFRAAVPSGASTGVYEALELRDGVKADYHGKGVKTAVENIKTVIGPALLGMDPADQKGIDKKMVEEIDGTQNEWGWCKKKARCVPVRWPGTCGSSLRALTGHLAAGWCERDPRRLHGGVQGGRGRQEAASL